MAAALFDSSPPVLLHPSGSGASLGEGTHCLLLEARPVARVLKWRRCRRLAWGCSPLNEPLSNGCVPMGLGGQIHIFRGGTWPKIAAVCCAGRSPRVLTEGSAAAGQILCYA